MSLEHAELVASLSEDGLTVREVVVPTQDVIYVKSILEAHPGLASVHAKPGRETSGGARLSIATTAGLVEELDGVLSELTTEAGLVLVEETEGEA
jgi:hypothetical protein